MAMRVKRLVGQGAQNIGGFTADKVQPANTPFQTMQAPLLKSDAGQAASAIGSGLNQVASALSAMQEEDERNRREAFLLKTKTAGDEFSTNNRLKYTAPLTTKDPVTGTEISNPDSAMGERATDTWFASQKEGWTKYIEKVQASEEYQKLNTASRLAIDKAMQVQQKASIGNAMQWKLQQGEVSRNAAHDAEIEASANAAVGAPDGQIGTAVQGLANSVISKLRSSGAPQAQVETEVRTQLDAAMRTKAQNIVDDTNNQDRAAALQHLLDTGSSVSVNGKVVQLSADARQDIRNKITLLKSGDKVRDAAINLHNVHGTNTLAAQAAIDANPKLSAAQKTEAYSQYKQRVAGVEEARVNVLAQRYRGLAERASRGEDINDAMMEGLDDGQKQSLRRRMRQAELDVVNPNNDRVTKARVLGEDDGLVGGWDHYISTYKPNPRALAKLSHTELSNMYEDDLSKEDWDKVQLDWAEAGGKVAALDNAARANLDRVTKLATAVQKDNRLRMKQQMAKFGEQYNLADNNREKAQAARLAAVVWAQFDDLNTGDTKMTSEDLSKIVQGVMTKFSIDGDAAYVGQLRQRMGIEDQKDFPNITSVPKSDVVEYHTHWRRGYTGSEPSDEVFEKWLGTFNRQSSMPTGQRGLTTDRKTFVIRRLKKHNLPTDDQTILRYHRLFILRGLY